VVPNELIYTGVTDANGRITIQSNMSVFDRVNQIHKRKQRNVT
jgi:hypothetical protein